MMMTPEQESLACKYVVVKYVPDLVRDEPLNIGIILQSQRNFSVVSQFITDFQYRHLEDRLDIKPEFLKEATRNIRETYLNRPDQALFIKLNMLTKIFDGQVRITTPRVTLAKDLDKAEHDLFEMFISIKHLPTFEKEITHRRILVDVYEFVSNYNSKIIKDIPIQGEKSSFDFALGLLEEAHFYHTISFDELYASNRAKLLDWGIKDILASARNRNLSERSFGTIVARPDRTNPKYEEKIGEFEEGMKILDNGKYGLVIYDKNSDAWKRKVKDLIPA